MFRIGAIMATRVGSAVFEDHISMEVWPGSWTDTFVFPVRYDAALPPWDYAEVVKTTIPVLKKLRKGVASLWVPVIAPGKWYFDEVKYALRNPTIPVAVTNGREQLPRTIDFSVLPGIREIASPSGLPAEEPCTSKLSLRTIRCLLALARLTVAYTNEIARYCLINEAYCLESLRVLESLGYVEHCSDPLIDFHLMTARQKASMGIVNDKEVRPYWRIRRPGVSAALRHWGVPAGVPFEFRTERNKLLDSPHRRRSRQWPTWVKKALPHANIYAGWSEVGIPGLRANPDSLAWGEINGMETLFWMEVESGKSSRQLILDKTITRWRKAVTYADYVGVHLVFAFLGMPWVRNAARLAFMDVPKPCAVVVADWSKDNFGHLPYPKWGEVVFE
jgi:hypothetical protein